MEDVAGTSVDTTTNITQGCRSTVTKTSLLQVATGANIRLYNPTRRIVLPARKASIADYPFRPI